MKISKLLLCFSLAAAFVLCVFAFLGQSTAPLFAGDTVAPQSFQDRVTASAGSAREVRAQSVKLNLVSNRFDLNASSPRTTPRAKVVAACLAGGKLCNSNAECCSGLCGCQNNPGGRCNVC
jgi:hypothetical protein